MTVTVRDLRVVLLRAANVARRVVWRVFGPRTVGVRGLVVGDDGRVLLVRHSYGPPAWHLPGGGVRRREALVDALHRELAEECGVAVKGPVRQLGTYSNTRKGKSDHITVFVVERFDRRSSHDPEIDTVRFFPADRLPDEASPGTRRRVAEWAGERVPDFSW